MRSGRGVGEQQRDVLLPDIAAVDPIGRTRAALDPAGDLRSPRVSLSARLRGMSTSSETSAKSRAGRVAVPAKMTSSMPPPRSDLGRALAHHPADRFQQVGLAAAVGADDAGQARLDLSSAGSTKLEATEFQPAETQRSTPYASCQLASASLILGSSVPQFEPVDQRTVDQEGRRPGILNPETASLFICTSLVPPHCRGLVGLGRGVLPAGRRKAGDRRGSARVVAGGGMPLERPAAGRSGQPGSCRSSSSGMEQRRGSGRRNWLSRRSGRSGWRPCRRGRGRSCGIPS